MAPLTTTEILSLSTLSLTCIAIIANTFHGEGEPLIASFAFSGIAFAFTYVLIPELSTVMMSAGLCGKDMSKLKRPVM